MTQYRLIAPIALAAAILAGVPTADAPGAVIETVCGTGQPEGNGDAGPAREINVGSPFGVEFGPDGALYVAEVGNHRVMRLDLKTRRLSTVAGTGRQGYSGDGGPATEAQLDRPHGICVGTDGAIYIGDTLNHRVRRVRAPSTRPPPEPGNSPPRSP